MLSRATTVCRTARNVPRGCPGPIARHDWIRVKSSVFDCSRSIVPAAVPLKLCVATSANVGQERRVQRKHPLQFDAFPVEWVQASLLVGGGPVLTIGVRLGRRWKKGGGFGNELLRRVAASEVRREGSRKVLGSMPLRRTTPADRPARVQRHHWQAVHTEARQRSRSPGNRRSTSHRAVPRERHGVVESGLPPRASSCRARGSR